MKGQGLDDAEVGNLVRGLERDYRSAPVSPSDRAMLDYAMKLTTRPAEIAAEDVQKLRDAGFSDAAVHDICAIAAYYAFVNRIADGLGVEVEASET